MKKYGLAFAAAVVMALAMPHSASAETTVIKKIYKSGPRAEMYRDRGWHRGWRPHHRHADRVVVIKKSRHRW